MEHEVFVPVPSERLREALADPARVARAVPGLQQDAGTAPVSGRLKVRVGGHAITYRGALQVVGRDDGSYSVAGDATEARGSGSVKLALTMSLRPARGGSTLAFGGTATADGRIAELPADAVASASMRLLNRFAERLAEASGEAAETSGEGVEAAETSKGAAGAEKPSAASAPETVSPAESAPDAPDLPDLPDAPDAPDASDAPDVPETPDADAATASPDGAQDSGRPAAEEPSGFETEVPPPSLANHDEDDFEGGFEEEGADAEAPAEAAHARRTMIGRSAEEVDHAPPRGRYAPVPAPEALSGSATLRWAAPAAALVLASAVVVRRVLRRRR